MFKDVPEGIEVRRPKSNIWWLGYAKSLVLRGLMEPEKVKPFILRLRQADRELAKRDILTSYHKHIKVVDL